MLPPQGTSGFDGLHDPPEKGCGLDVFLCAPQGAAASECSQGAKGTHWTDWRPGPPGLTGEEMTREGSVPGHSRDEGTWGQGGHGGACSQSIKDDYVFIMLLSLYTAPPGCRWIEAGIEVKEKPLS